MNPRFSEENIAANRSLLARIEELAVEKGVTPAQLALAWVLARGSSVVPIPGTTSPARLEENAASADLVLSEEELARISEAVPAGSAAGTRYPEEMMGYVNS